MGALPGAILRAGAGATLAEILEVIVPKGWFLPVTPGTKFVSLGGCVAADVHGKNHHHDGSFCGHVIAIDLILADGNRMACSAVENSDMAQYAPYFQRVESRQFVLRGVTFYFVLGYSFDYASYKEHVLKPIKEKYYKIPDYLPHAPCYFCEKYFPEEVLNPRSSIRPKTRHSRAGGNPVD